MPKAIVYAFRPCAVAIVKGSPCWSVSPCLVLVIAGTSVTGPPYMQQLGSDKKTTLDERTSGHIVQKKAGREKTLCHRLKSTLSPLPLPLAEPEDVGGAHRQPLLLSSVVFGSWSIRGGIGSTAKSPVACCWGERGERKSGSYELSFCT